MAEILILENRVDRIGTILVAVAGGLSTLAVSALLLHMASVAIISPLKQHSSSQSLPRERVFLATHLGYYLTCLLISGLFLGIASFLEIIWAQTGVILDDARCNTQGIFLQLGEIGTAAFSVIIAFHTMNNLVIMKHLPTIAALFVIALGWAITLLLAILGPSLNPHFYDIEGLWCWISIDQPSYQVFGNLLPLLIAVVLMIFIYGAIFIKLRIDASDGGDDPISISKTVGLSNAEYRKFLRPIARKLVFYPLVFAILILPISIIRILILFNVSPPTYFIIFAAVCDALLGFANTVVYVTTRNIGPSISWGGVRTSAVGLLRPESSFGPSSDAHLDEKPGSIYSIGVPRLVESTNEIRVDVASPAMKPTVVRSPEEPPPSFRAIPESSDISDTSSVYPVVDRDEVRPEPAYVHRVGAAESVSRWREQRGAYRAPSPRVNLPSSPQMTPNGYLRGSPSLDSLRSNRSYYDRTPIRYLQSSSVVGHMDSSSSANPSNIIESYFNVPESLRPATPVMQRSNMTPTPTNLNRVLTDESQYSFSSQASNISHSHVRNNSYSSSSSSSGNLPFALYPGHSNQSSSRSMAALAEALQIREVGTATNGPITVPVPGEMSGGFRSQSSRNMI